MHENNAAGHGRRQDALHGPMRIVRDPIVAGGRPSDHAQFRPLRLPVHESVGQSSWCSEKSRVLARGLEDGLRSAPDFLGGPLRRCRPKAERGMRISMVLHLVPRILRGTCQLGSFVHPLSDAKKCGPRPEAAQDIENARCLVGIRAIVDCKPHFPARCGKPLRHGAPPRAIPYECRDKKCTGRYCAETMRAAPFALEEQCRCRRGKERGRRQPEALAFFRFHGLSCRGSIRPRRR